MNLRNNIYAPDRFGDNQDYPAKRGRSRTKPALSKAMMAQVVSFKPQPAAFPSLPLTGSPGKQKSVRHEVPISQPNDLLDECIRTDPTNVATFGDIDQRGYGIQVDWHNSNNRIGERDTQLGSALPSS